MGNRQLVVQKNALFSNDNGFALINEGQSFNSMEVTQQKSPFTPLFPSGEIGSIPRTGEQFTIDPTPFEAFTTRAEGGDSQAVGVDVKVRVQFTADLKAKLKS